MNCYSFYVEGIPKPGGSKKTVPNKKTGRPIVVEDCKDAPKWRRAVEKTAIARFGKPRETGAIRLEIVFYLPRPKGQFGTGKNSGRLRPSAPPEHLVKPDATKLLRNTEDALTGILWQDDAQIIDQHILKTYTDIAHPPGALIRIWTQEDSNGNRNLTRPPSNN